MVAKNFCFRKKILHLGKKRKKKTLPSNIIRQAIDMEGLYSSYIVKKRRDLDKKGKIVIFFVEISKNISHIFL